MDENEGVWGVADVPRAAGGFFDFAAVDFDLEGVRAGLAAEEGGFHVWDYWGCTDDETFDADEFVGV